MQTYFISDGRAVKIGRSSNVEARLADLQTGSSEKLWLIHSIDGDHEKHFHTEYAQYRIEKSEWFRLSDFYIWLMHQIERDDWIGDFARDARGDKTFPIVETNYWTIINTLECNHSVCREARKAFTMAYREFMWVQRKQGITIFVKRFRKDCLDSQGKKAGLPKLPRVTGRGARD